MERILSSPVFAQSERLSRFLRFIVELSLAGRSDEIKEYVIATEVFGRKPSFDPRFDSAVRVEAIRLRGKLREYYDTCGRTDPMVIEVPKGGYVPLFHLRQQESTATRLRRWWPLAAGLACLALAVPVYLALRPATTQ